MTSDSIAIGNWSFCPGACELRRGDEVRRIEPRSARALELLCEAKGEVVSQDAFVERVWEGRALSANSVPVVIAQLRKALDDDAREPQLLETIPKRGYRLRVSEGAPAELASPRRTARVAAILPLVVMLVAGGWALSASRERQPLTIDIRSVDNATGNATYGPLSRATSELIVDRFGKRGYRLQRGAGADLVLRSKLVMWDGHPSLSMAAVDRNAVVRWTAMMDASPGKVPLGVSEALDGFAARFSPAEGRERVAQRQAGS